ncbi:MAG: FHA domain-containing protein [Tannerella sp.]|jgi:pSer/pThr/pTyr-binding forkhead associated (FHA) protein/V8-like Glu-specific endopeptidase|nr:FHA domain-containing protein [Tannerella sp.]
MATQATEIYKRTVSGSIGAGIGSVFGSGKSYYILEHKTSSRYHKAGESQEIIVNQIELGRDPKCQVQYDESFTTVSRRHAAIARDGDNWKIISLSETNSTLVNAQRIEHERYLQNGDEIQLSSGGPRLGFILPQGRQANVGSIGLSRRLSLFHHQALRPYKQAITALSVFLLLVIAGAIWWGTENQKKQNKILEDLKKAEIAVIKAQEDLNTAHEKLDELTEENRKLIEENKEVDLQSYNQHVFAISLDELVWELPTGEKFTLSQKGIIGSGFLLNDGRFVTARHVLEPWFYYPYLSEAAHEYYRGVNYAAFNQGKVSARYTGISSAGDKISFTNEQIICNRANDKISKEPYKSDADAIVRTSTNDRDDWAFYQTSKTSGLKFNNERSEKLAQNVQLYILGFPGGAEDINNLRPLYSSCVTSLSGQENGLILSSNDNTASGSSGSPVFVRENGELIIIGLASGQNVLKGSKGIIIPISEVRR